MGLIIFLKDNKGLKIPRKEFIPSMMSRRHLCGLLACSDWLMRPGVIQNHNENKAKNFSVYALGEQLH